MTHDVFISYSNHDKTVADVICATLESRKIQCWIASRDVTLDEDYISALVRAIANSRIFLLVFSKESNISPNVMREIKEAVSRGIPIIPFRIDDVTPSDSMEFYLSSTHWLEAFTPPLEKHLQRLADIIQTMVQTSTENPPLKGKLTPEPPSKMKLITTSNIQALSEEELTIMRDNGEKLNPIFEDNQENASNIKSERFSKKWESKKEDELFANRIKDTVKPQVPLKQRLSFALKRIDLQVLHLDQRIERFSQREKAIYSRVIDACSKNDNVRAKVFANELADVREMAQRTINAKLALEQITLRLRTVSELGDVVLTLGPAVGVLRSVRAGLTSLFPEAENELGEIGNMLSGIMVEAGQGSGMTLNFDTVNEGASKILTEAATVAEQKIKDKFPDLPQSASTKSFSSEQANNGMKEKEYIPNKLALKTAEAPEEIIDKVHFSVISSSQVCIGASFVVDIWAHLGEQRTEVIQRAHEELPGIDISISSKGPVNVARGTVLTIRLKINDLKIENSEDTLMWENEIGKANFRVNVPEKTTSGSKPGTATVYANGIQIARIFFNIQVGKETFRKEKIQTKQELVHTAFASYASQDRIQVLARIQGIQKIAPQLEVDMDLKFRSGQYWEKELWKSIPSKDVFYLFWSSNAAKSEWVEKEWRCALRTRGLDFIDPVPLESPEQVPPPPELSSKHFNDWVLAYMRKRK